MDHQFLPAQLTSTMLEMYLSALQQEGASPRSRVKSVLKGVCQRLLVKHQVLIRNPVRGITVEVVCGNRNATPLMCSPR